MIYFDIGWRLYTTIFFCFYNDMSGICYFISFIFLQSAFVYFLMILRAVINHSFMSILFHFWIYSIFLENHFYFILGMDWDMI